MHSSELIDEHVKCKVMDEHHTDEINYESAPVETWFNDVHHVLPPKDLISTGVARHGLRCARHGGPVYVTVEEAERGIPLDDVRLLEHPDYLKALAHLDEELALLPVVESSVAGGDIEGTRTGQVLVRGESLPRGRYRLDFGDGIRRVLVV
jgi:hypothetical protein